MKTNSQDKKPKMAGSGNHRRAKVSIPTLKLERILVPLDFSGKSRQALKLAVPLAERYGGRIILLHVMQPPGASAWRVIPGGGHYLGMQSHTAKDVARQRLQATALELVPAGLRGQSVLVKGNPAQEIMSAARRLNVELIVISTQGHTGLKKMLIGSTTERVVREAPCAVLTVRRR